MEISFKIEDRLVRQLKAVDRKIAGLAAVLSDMTPQVRAAVQTQARISTVGASTRIENAVLTDAQIEWIDTVLREDGRPHVFSALRPQIEAKIVGDRERSLEEVAGCREVLELIHSQGRDLFPLTHATLCGLHRELLQYYAPAAPYLGRYKLTPNSVVERNESTGAERVVLQTSDPGPITVAAMDDILACYNQTHREHPWPIAVACELVFRFLACHPFQDGNGRLGRALFLLALIQSDDPHLAEVSPYLAIDRFIEQNKSEYYSVLARVSDGRFRQDATEYQMGLFLAFMLKAVNSALDSFTLYHHRVLVIQGLSPNATTLLRCFKELPEQRLAPRQVEKETALAPRTISRILGSLVRAGLLQRYGSGAGTRYQLVF